MSDVLIYNAAAAAAVRIVVLIILALALHGLATRLLPRFVNAMYRLRQGSGEPLSMEEEVRRRETISHVLLRTADILLTVVFGIMILSELGFDLAPLLASAGIVGIAIGFGAQTLIRDVLSGIFILLENQYGKGDLVRIAATSGVVEDINLRRTVLRDLDGVVHSVPNGEVRIASNLTRGWSRVNVSINVGHREELDRIWTALDRVGEEMAADSAWASHILEAPKVQRVDALEESGVVLVISATTRPMKHLEVAGELRRRVKIAFDREGIRTPFSAREVPKSEAAPGASPDALKSEGASNAPPGPAAPPEEVTKMAMIDEQEGR